MRRLRALLPATLAGLMAAGAFVAPASAATNTIPVYDWRTTPAPATHGEIIIDNNCRADITIATKSSGWTAGVLFDGIADVPYLIPNQAGEWIEFNNWTTWKGKPVKARFTVEQTGGVGVVSQFVPDGCTSISNLLVVEAPNQTPTYRNGSIALRIDLYDQATGDLLPNTVKGATGFWDLDGTEITSTAEGVTLGAGFNAAYVAGDAELNNYAPDTWAGAKRDSPWKDPTGPVGQLHYVGATFTGPTMHVTYFGKLTQSILFAPMPVAIQRPAVVTYLPGQGGTGTMDDTMGVLGETLTLTANSFTRDGYSFTGWKATDGAPYGDGQELVAEHEYTTLTAQWEPNPAAVRYLPGAGGTGSMDDTTGVTDQHVTVSENGFTREGYTFIGWKSPTGTPWAPGEDFQLSPGTSTLIAQWQANPSQITYKPEGGTGTIPPTSGRVDEDLPVTSNTFRRDGYTQTGWKNCTTGTIVTFGDSLTLPVGGVELCATWAADATQLTYHPAGGGGTMPTTGGVTDEQVTVASNGFTRTGYSFTGWASSQNAATSVQPGDTVTLAAGGSHLWATWQPNPARLAYTPGGGTGSMDDTTGVTDQNVTVSENGFTREGYTFTGWKTENGATWAGGDTLKLPAGTTTLTAQWTADPAWVAYSPGGGEGRMDPTTGLTDQNVTVSENGFTREGYTFTGWKAEDSTPYAPTDLIRLPAGGVTLTAQWQANPSQISYKPAGGTGSTPPTIGVTDGRVPVRENSFTRTGYGFNGWQRCQDHTPLSVGTMLTLPAGGVDLCATWVAQPAYLIYQAGGGHGTMPAATGVTDQEVSVSDNGFTREGYTFTSWKAEDGTEYVPGEGLALPAGITTLIAQWEADPATITYAPGEGGEGQMDDTVGLTDQKVSVSDNGFTRTGYHFTGWKTPDGRDWAPGASVALPAGTTTLTAQWTPDEARITYRPEGGIGTTPDTVGHTDETVTVADNGFTRDGHHFTGWRQCGTQTGIQAGTDLTLPAGGIELCATWAANTTQPLARTGTNTIPGLVAMVGLISAGTVLARRSRA